MQFINTDYSTAVTPIPSDKNRVLVLGSSLTLMPFSQHFFCLQRGSVYFGAYHNH